MFRGSTIKALERLTEIHADLNKIIAVHEHRLNQHEKTYEALVESIEKRREEISEVSSHLYTALEIKIKDLMTEYVRIAEINTTQHSKMNDRITSLSRYIWTGVGVSIGISIFVSLITVGANIFHLFK